MVYQKTHKTIDEIELPFCGDSCFPVSPIEQSGDECNVSNNDQMFSIIRVLNVTAKEANCFEKLQSFNYLEQMISNEAPS